MLVLKMATFQCLILVLVATLALDSVVANDAAKPCESDSCTIDNNCRCSSQSSPLSGDVTDWPQLISLTFDEAVTQHIFDNSWIPLLQNIYNPDNNPISGTFFVPHEYTSYERVNDLYNYGFEIGVHSITKNPLQTYWRDASQDTLTKEFKGQKQIISTYANIPAEAITGVRTPQLQLAGNTSIDAYIASELTYDSSWPSLPTKRLFPYTLDYLSTEQCLLGAECPNEAFPGYWVLPINDLTGPNGTECNSLATCGIEGSVEEIATYLDKQIDGVRSKTRTPITLLVNSYWFEFTENSFNALRKFLEDTVKRDEKDTFFVSQKQVLAFTKSPVKLADFKTDDLPEPANCDPYPCRLKKGNEDRNMDSCVPCPDVYPWIDNVNV
ncbi:chitin deacetylase 8-like [Diabrotica undecimpunctata]|uniref:chitin deacetylase 8-like n=1 Tax=Diabrotica undecimpunctata TaxID=50387 RepID=UPI003B639D9E